MVAGWGLVGSSSQMCSRTGSSNSSGGQAALTAPFHFLLSQLLEPLELTSDLSAAELVMLPLWPSLISTRCQSLLLPAPAGKRAARGGSLHTSLISKHQHFSTCLLAGFHCIASPPCCHLPSQKHSGPTGVCLCGGFWNSSAKAAADLVKSGDSLLSHSCHHFQSCPLSSTAVGNG